MLNRSNTITFISFDLGLLLTSYSFSLSPLITVWYRLPLLLVTLMVAWGPLWLTVGSLSSGRLGDLLGRRRAYLFNIVSLLIGLTFFTFFTYAPMTLFGLALLLIGAGGEFSSVLASTHEIFGPKTRGTAMLLELNFVSIGAMVAAAVLLLVGRLSFIFQRYIVSLVLLAMILSIIATRARVPESKVWKLAKESRSSISGPSIRFRLVMVVLMAISEVIGYNMMVNALGPYYFPTLTPTLIFLGNASESVVGLTGLFIDRYSRKVLMLLGTSGSFLVFAYMFITVGSWSLNIGELWIPFIIYNAFISIMYITVNTLNGELWPTTRRGTYTAVVSSLTMGFLVPLELIMPHFPITYYMALILVMWGVGVAAAIVWYLKGIETAKGRGTLEASGEELEVTAIH